MQLVWEVSYRSGARTVRKEFTDVLGFNAFVKNFEGNAYSELTVGMKLKADLVGFLPSFLPRMLMPAKESK